MTFSFYAPPTLSGAQAGGGSSLLNAIISGISDAQKARQLKALQDAQIQKAKLENVHAQQENQYYAPNMKSQMALRQAQLEQAQANAQKSQFIQKLQQQLLGNGGETQPNMSNMPDINSSSPQGQYALTPEQMQRLAKAMPPPSVHGASQPSKLSREDMLNKIAFGINTYTPSQHHYAPSNLGKEQQEYEDVEAGYYPGSNRTRPFESPQVQEEYAAPYREKLGGLTQGQHYVYDPETHKKIGVQKPYSPKEKETLVGRTFFDKVYPTINNGFKDFIGKGSATNFVKYADAYGKDRNATKKIDDLLLAQKLVSAGVVNEAATLGSGKTNMTYRNLAKSFPGSDVSTLIQQYGNQLKIPGEAFWKANIRFKKMLDDATKQAQASVPAFKTEYFNPEEHVKSETSNKKASYTDDDIKATAAKYGISEDEVRKKLKEASK
jgi:hypothetical protein